MEILFTSVTCGNVMFMGVASTDTDTFPLTSRIVHIAGDPWVVLGRDGGGREKTREGKCIRATPMASPEEKNIQ